MNRRGKRDLCRRFFLGEGEGSPKKFHGSPPKTKILLGGALGEKEEKKTAVEAVEQDPIFEWVLLEWFNGY